MTSFGQTSIPLGQTFLCGRTWSSQITWFSWLAMLKDNYAMLGLDHGATRKEIKEAYKKHARRCLTPFHDSPLATRRATCLLGLWLGGVMTTLPERLDGWRRS